jgi:hypothetical protein
MKTFEWLIIDGIAPFFRGYGKKRINWSKIPFSYVEKSGMLDAGSPANLQLRMDFKTFIKRAKADGYNAVTLDDLVHLLLWDGYADTIYRRLSDYRRLYGELVTMASEAGLRVLITSDVFSLSPSLLEATGGKLDAVTGWLCDRLDTFFQEMPAIAGIVFRIGESDAIGTEGEFISRLLIRKPDQANRFLRQLVPVFERHSRVLFFRTWTVGAYAIGDLIWHRRTFRRAFRGLDSDCLILSMKYGESDFFRYLPVNQHFFRSGLRTIVEFQTRREYEGFGEYPSFVGWEYSQVLNHIGELPGVVGASIWCQTGGWGKFRRLTWLDDSSIWVELNNRVTAGLCRGEDCETAIRQFCEQRLPGVDPEAMIAFLTLSDDVIRELLYVREFASRKLFFRRLRVPPLIFPYWDRMMMSPAVRRVFRHMVENHVLCIHEAQTALRKLDAMRRLARSAGIPDQGLDFQYDTFSILAQLRTYIFADPADEPALIAELLAQRKAYKQKWKPRYSVKFSFDPPKRYLVRFAWIRRLFLREQRGYRLVDSILTLRLLALVYPLLGRWRQRLVPKFARKQAMGIDSVFK